MSFGSGVFDLVGLLWFPGFGWFCGWLFGVWCIDLLVWAKSVRLLCLGLITSWAVLLLCLYCCCCLLLLWVVVADRWWFVV